MSYQKTACSRIAANLLVALAILAGPTLQAQASSDKATWIQQTIDYTRTNMTRVDSFMWYNNANPGEPDWRIVPSSPAVINAYNNASASWITSGRTRGVFINGNPKVTGRLTNFMDQVGQHERVGWYESFASDFPLANIQNTVGLGSRPYIVWEPYDVNAGVGSVYDPTTGLKETDSLLPLINRGNYDAKIIAWAQAAKTSGVQMDIAFGHEMNGFWRSWGYLPENYYDSPYTLTLGQVGHNGNSPQAYVDAFRRVASIFNSEGAGNVNFVWDVNADWVDTFSVAFPGESYVDRLGMNGFNWGLTMQDDPFWLDWSDWREGQEIFDGWNGFSTYDKLCDLPGNLPIIIGETGTNNTPEPASLVFMVAGCMLLLRKRRR